MPERLLLFFLLPPHSPHVTPLPPNKYFPSCSYAILAHTGTPLYVMDYSQFTTYSRSLSFGVSYLKNEHLHDNFIIVSDAVLCSAA